MSRKTFETGDQIGPYVIDSFAGNKVSSGEPCWWVTENGESKIITEKKLRTQLAKADWTPEKLKALSSKALEELRKEIGSEAIDDILNIQPAKPTKPENFDQQKIASQWLETHPQVPLTRKNTQLFDDFLGKLEAPTFSVKDWDLAFAELFPQLEFDLKAANFTEAEIKQFGEAVRGSKALEKFTSSQLLKLQKSYPRPKPEPDFSKMTQSQIIDEIGKQSKTSEEFLENTRKLDEKLGIKQPISPMQARAEAQIWQTFFSVHTDLTDTPELREALEAYLNRNHLRLLNQYLDLGLEQLIEEKSPAVTYRESNVHQHGGTRSVNYQPRSSRPLPAYDSEEMTVTVSEINQMSSEEYSKRLQNPSFRSAVDALMQKIGR